MREILLTDSLATFMFVGNADEGQSYYKTRRYRFYCQMVKNSISDKYFSHIISDEASLYILLNKQYMAQDPDIQNSVTNEFFSRFLLEDTHIEGSETQINLNRY